MPTKHAVKTYVENSYYHLFNRGVEKRIIFTDDQDYKTFLYLLKRYLSHPDTLDVQVRPVRKVNLSEEIHLLAYCLMPNHFHLLVKQVSKNALTKLTRRLNTAYATFFNQRHQRSGSLFEGKLKGILIDTEPYLLHLTAYIHRNPAEIWSKSLVEYPYSSYAEYLGLRNTAWIHPNEILPFFRSPRNIQQQDYLSYESFVENPKQDPAEFLLDLTLE